VGAPAPDFTLPDQHRRPVRLADFIGRAEVVLVFFPFAFTPTCSGEIEALRDAGAALSRDDVAVLAVSCDPSSALRVFGEQLGIDTPLLSDFWPHGEVARAYGVFNAERGFATRGTFVIDRAGVVRWSVVNEADEPRDTADYVAAVDALRA
jgi:peroxiredoxin